MSFEKYLTNSDRKFFFFKVLPVLFLGATIWLASDLLFSYLLINYLIREINYSLYLGLIFLILLGFIILYFVARAGKNITAMIIYFSIAFSAGIISIPLFVLRPDFSIDFHFFISRLNCLSYGSFTKK